MKFNYTFLVIFVLITTVGFSQEETFGVVNMNLSDIYRISDAETKSISLKNFTGENGKGAMAELTGTDSEPARELGKGGKANPFVKIKPSETFTLTEITDEVILQYMRMTSTGNWPFSILKIYRDDEKEPSVEVHVGDFFGMGWDEYAHLNFQQRFGTYCWNIQDPIRFDKGLKVTIQDLGWRSEHRYFQQQSDISFVSCLDQLEPHGLFAELPSKNDLEVN